MPTNIQVYSCETMFCSGPTMNKISSTLKKYGFKNIITLEILEKLKQDNKISGYSLSDDMKFITITSCLNLTYQFCNLEESQ